MTDDECDQITADRFAEWRAKLAAEHATPMILIGAGHDRTRGTVVVCMPDGIPVSDMRAMLRGMLKKLG